MAKIKEHIVEQVINRADIVDVVTSFVELKRTGRTYSACCPFHNENTPSFKVNPARNTWHCFGSCGTGGDAVSFVMRQLNSSFPEAIEWLAKRYNIPIEYDKDSKPNPDAQRREAMLIALQEVQKFFVDTFNKPESAVARQYAYRRWSENFCKVAGIGFAPEGWQGLVDYARDNAISEQSLLDLGVIRKREKSSGCYDFFRGRVTIPIYDRFGRVIGFTARYIGAAEDVAKYINSTESLVYSKSASLFGINVALREAAKQDKFFLVEGAPDVLRLQSIGVNNTVAALGTAWTEQQFMSLKRHSLNLCFIPDSDPPKRGERFGAGVKAVIHNGTTALSLGFNVSVKEIPESAKKSDPDSFITSQAILTDLEEQDFILWYARKLFSQDPSQADKKKAINEIAALVAPLEEEVSKAMYVDELAKLDGTRNLWNKAITEERKRQSKERFAKADKALNLETFNKYGFNEAHNCYFSITKEGTQYQWSNFVLRPMFHVQDPVSAIRLFQIKNENNVSAYIEFKQDDLVSLTRFKTKVESMGNFVWLAKEEQLTKLKLFLYEDTETAIQISQLGWQPQGFFAFGNGAFTTEWHPVDELGIVRMPDIGNFYLPAFSKIYAKDTTFYQFERNFVHLGYGAISLQEYCQRMVNVFGDNAKVGLAFLLATLFRDVVVSVTKSFPMLNLFGPKGSGKSELGHSLMSFFIIDNIPPNIQNSTVPALADTVAQSANALVHLDELKNDMDVVKREFLKGLWDGTGRNRMNMDRDKKREVTKVSCGVIISGQEMPTADIALLSRVIHLSYSKSEFTTQAKKQFDALRSIRKKGCTHLTMRILQYRKRFESNFAQSYSACLDELSGQLVDFNIEDRILRNWLIPLAAFHTMKDVLNMGFTYENLLEISVKGIVAQNMCVKQNDELTNFWQFLEYLMQDGKAFPNSDFSVRNLYKLKCDGKKLIEFEQMKPVLYLRFNRISQIFDAGARMANTTRLPISSLMYYLTTSPAYYGKKVMRFDIRVNGILQEEIDTDGLRTTRRKSTKLERAMCFDYDMICDLYNINLITLTSQGDESDEDEQPPSNEPQQGSLFETQ